MRVAANDDADAVAHEIDGKLREIVQEMEADAGELERAAPGQPVGEAAAIVVAADRDDRGDLAERRQDLRAPDVTRVQDGVGAMQRGQRFGANEPVRVGDDADPLRPLAQ